MAAKLKKGDAVVVIAGKDKGKEGTIQSVDPKSGKAVVEGINIAIRHTRQSQNSQGGKTRKLFPSSCRTLPSKMPTANPPASASRSKTARRCVSPRPRGT